LIFLDAVGTLFGVRGGVGNIYAEIARNHGVTCDPHLLDQAFYCAFDGAEPLVFSDLPLEEIPVAEYAWWQEIALKTFAKTEDLVKFADFSKFFNELFGYFATADAWYIYPDTIVALEMWKQQGIELGIISNFDSRLYLVLRALDLDKYFSSVTISTEANSAKPDRLIFDYARNKHSQTASAIYIGDSYGTDVLGAIASGLQGIWINREPKPNETRPYICQLTELDYSKFN
jgi:putative hydrolase of the HAD superfamily